MIQFPDRLHSIPAITNIDSSIFYFGLENHMLHARIKMTIRYVVSIWLGTRKRKTYLKHFSSILKMYPEHNLNVKIIENIFMSSLDSPNGCQNYSIYSIYIGMVRTTHISGVEI